MKQSDIFTLIIVASVGVIVSFIACNSLLGNPDLATTKFKKLKHVVTSDLVQPDPEVFNSLAINPTIEVYVGDCEDIDQNGMLDTAELVACGKEEAPAEEEVVVQDGGENVENGAESGATE